VEDDRPLRERLARAMEARGFVVTIAEGVAEGKARVKESPPAYAVVDLKLEDDQNLDLEKEIVPEIRGRAVELKGHVEQITKV